MTKNGHYRDVGALKGHVEVIVKMFIQNAPGTFIQELIPVFIIIRVQKWNQSVQGLCSFTINKSDVRKAIIQKHGQPIQSTNLGKILCTFWYRGCWNLIPRGIWESSQWQRIILTRYSNWDFRVISIKMTFCNCSPNVEEKVLWCWLTEVELGVELQHVTWAMFLKFRHGSSKLLENHSDERFQL